MGEVTLRRNLPNPLPQVLRTTLLLTHTLKRRRGVSLWTYIRFVMYIPESKNLNLFYRNCKEF